MIQERRHLHTRVPLDEQAYTLQALMTGFLDAVTRPLAPSSISVDDPDKVMAAAVTALLGPEDPGQTDVSAAPRKACGCCASYATPCWWHGQSNCHGRRPRRRSPGRFSRTKTRTGGCRSAPRAAGARDGCLTGRFVHGSAAPSDGSSAGGRVLDGEDLLHANSRSTKDS
ncbi:hypothetical protein [Streptomyces sp. NPDC001537]